MPADDSADALAAAVRQASSLYYRLVLVAGASGAGKTAALHSIGERTGAAVVNTSLELSRRMLAQRLRLEWLEATAGLALAGQDKEASESALNEMLADKLSVNSCAVRGSRHKTVTILRKIWLDVPFPLETLRDEGLRMHSGLDAKHRHALHWGMTLAVYPFWGVVAVQVGRLLRLQGSTAAAQVQRRVRESHGERQTVSRATARVLRSFIDWEALRDTDSQGVYAPAEQRRIVDAEVAAWLAEAVLRTQPSGAIGLNALLRHPSLFPYRLPHLAASQLAAHSPRLEAVRQGLDEDVLMLRTESTFADGHGPWGTERG